MSILSAIAIIALGYLLGSTPWAYLIARKAMGVDIREVDYGNPGAANVYRHVGRGAGIAVGLLDMGKGTLPVVMARIAGLPSYVALLAGLAALLGHWWPVFLGFRGGIGTATAIGATLAMLPTETLLGAPLAVATLAIARNTGFSALLLFSVATISAIWFDRPAVLNLAPPVLGGLVFFRARLWRKKGAEPKP